MGKNVEGFGRYTISCDDPYKRGCQETIDPHFGSNRIERIAEEQGWFLSEDTGKYACPTCMELHGITVKKKIANRSLPFESEEEIDDCTGDPFTAAFITTMFGGDPLTAGLTTFFTGNTSLGIIAGIMAGDDKSDFEGRGGKFGGGGASGDFHELVPAASGEDHIEHQVLGRDRAGDLLMHPATLPVIVNPFAEEQCTPVESHIPASEELREVKTSAVCGEAKEGTADTAVKEAHTETTERPSDMSSDSGTAY